MIYAPVIAIIGTGNMGTSLINGLIKNGHPPEKLWGTCPDKKKLEQIQHYFHIHTTTNNLAACEAADVIIFAVKPQVFQEVALSLDKCVQARHPLIISIAAGIRINSMNKWLGEEIAIVRAMPNTPALIGAGATALFANKFVNPEQFNLAESILRSVGLVVWLQNENLMDVVTALSGNGPAYFFLVMEALQDAAQQLGLSQETALFLIKKTALGSARMAIESEHSLEELRLKVTSPGGTTEKAVAVLEENHLREIFKKAMQAAVNRAKELG